MCRFLNYEITLSITSIPACDHRTPPATDEVAENIQRADSTTEMGLMTRVSLLWNGCNRNTSEHVGYTCVVDGKLGDRR